MMEGEIALSKQMALNPNTLHIIISACFQYGISCMTPKNAMRDP